MRQSNSVSPESFNTAFERLLPKAQLREIFEAYGPGVRRPPQLSAANLVRSMAFQALQGSGTLAESVKQTAKVKISDSALSQRRTRIGLEPFYWILETALGPKARVDLHPEAFYRGKRLVAIDGSQMSVVNTPQIREVMPKAKSRRGPAAFAKVGMCVLVELGLRNPIAAALGIQGESETVLAREVLDKIPEDALVLGDRHYEVRPVMGQLIGARREFLLRIKSTMKATVLGKNPDSSLRSEVRDGEQRWELREVAGKVRRPGGAWTWVRLWTNLTDWRAYPAQELLKLYAKRWGVFHRELKVEMRGGNRLRSHTPETAGQELAALLIAYAVVAQERIAAGQRGGVEVLRIRFAKTLQRVQSLWMVIEHSGGILSADQIRRLTQAVMRDIAENAIAPRRQRSCPRAVRQPVSSWPRLQENTSQNGPTEFQIISTLP
jgi:Transposase DDE domain